MKKIKFENLSAQKIYDSYMRRIERTIRSLSKSDQKEIAMELNSHIHTALESVHKSKDDELSSIIKITDKLGDPEIILSSLVEEKSLDRASRTFNPIHIARALVLNFKNGIIYSAYTVLYTAISLCMLLLGLKLFLPNDIGFLVSPEHEEWLIGYSTDPTYQDVLGVWFIPTGLVIMAILYIILTLSMRFKRKKN